MNLTTAKQIFDQLFATSTGYDLSRSAREKMSVNDKSFTYGEIDFIDFARILSEVPLTGKQVFYDLGSGVGKVVVAAALLGNFKRLYGIELLEPVFKEAKKILAHYNRDYKTKVDDTTLINFIHDDILDYDFSDADVIFFQATCFTDTLMLALRNKLEKLKEGSIVISVTKPIESPLYGVLHFAEYKMAWGNATVFVQKKFY